MTKINTKDANVGTKVVKPKVTTAKPKNLGYRNPEQGTVDYGRDLQKEYAASQIPTYQDPFNGVDPLTALLTALHQTGAKPSGGSGAGSRGNPALAAKAFADANGALDAQGAATNAGFDQRQQTLQGIQGQGSARLSGILGELNAGAGAARGATQQAFGQGDARLQALQQEYAGIASNRDAQANQTLGAFRQATGGASGSVNPSGGGVQDLLMAGRGANTMRGNAADQLYAQRGNVYNGLNADAQMQNGQTFDMLLAQLAQERQAQSAALAQQRAQLALQQAGA